VTGRVAALLLVPLAGIFAIVAVFLRLHFQPPTVPAYSLAGDAGADVTLRPGMTFEMVARPSSPPAGIVGAKGFLVRGSDALPWDAPATAEIDGTVRIGGPVDKVFSRVPAGTWDVVIAVGRPEMLPSMPSDVERPRDETVPAAWRALRQRVTWSPSTP
jgi:hypothetical protein